MNLEPRKSAAHIVIGKKRPAPNGFDDPLPPLRKLMKESGSNRHEQAIVAISACISDGIVTGSRIVDRLVRLGFNPRHAGMMLTNETGDDPGRHRWSRDPAGRYSLIS